MILSLIKNKADHMNTRAFALTSGVMGALYIFILTWWLIITGTSEGYTTFFERVWIFGYSVTPIGSIIGAIYGFIDFGIIGLFFAMIYNYLSER